MKLTEVIQEAQLSGEQILELLISIGEEMKANGDGLRLRFDQQYGAERAFDKVAACLEAVKNAKVAQTDPRLAARMRQGLQAVGMLTTDGNLKRVAETGDQVSEAGFVYAPHVMEAFAAAKLLWSQAEALDAYASNVGKIVSFIEEMADLPTDAKSYPFANAALKKLGVRA